MSGCYPSNLDSGAGEDTSPLVKQIQELQNQIENLKKNYAHLHHFGSPVLVESIKELAFDIKKQEQRIDSMHDGLNGICELWQQLNELRGKTYKLEDFKIESCSQVGLTHDWIGVLEKRIEECEKLINRIYELKKVTSEDVQAFDRLEKASKWLRDNGEILGDGKVLLKNFLNPSLNGVYTVGNKENPSRQHLEECLHRKNVQINELENEVKKCKNDLNGAIVNDRISRAENTKLQRQVDALLDQVKHHQSTNTTVHSGGKAGGFPCASSSAGGGIGGSHYDIKCCKNHPHVGGCL